MYHGNKTIAHSSYVLLTVKSWVQIDTKPVTSFGSLETEQGNTVDPTMCTERGNEAGGTTETMGEVKAKSKQNL